MLIKASSAGSRLVPTRLGQLIREFAHRVNQPGFPCVFATQPLAQDEILFGLAMAADAAAGIAVLMREAATAIRDAPEQIVVIFSDLPPNSTLEYERSFASEVLCKLRQEDSVPWPDDAPLDPRDPRWAFWFEGVGFFINFSSPGHIRRQSRNLGPAFTMVVQARSTFDVYGAESKVRKLIRSRVEEYDGMAPHPALGTYGDPASREVLQYFLGDDADSCELFTLDDAEATGTPRAAS